MSAPLQAIKSNAKSLISDAELLFKDERWARATSLAILAIEEVGKYYMLCTKKATSTNTYREHFSKQELAARMFRVGVMVVALKSFLKERGFTLKHISTFSDIEKKWYESEQANLIIKKLKKEAAESIPKRLEKSEEADFIHSVTNKLLLNQKNAGFMSISMKITTLQATLLL